MGCNPDILENIVQRAGGPRDIYVLTLYIGEK
jgi:hypothetical protein